MKIYVFLSCITRTNNNAFKGVFDGGNYQIQNLKILNKSDDNFGATSQLTVTITPDDATDKTIIWLSSDVAVVTVDYNSLITAIAPGTATITATTSNSKTATCVVTVTAIVVPVSNITINKSTESLTVGAISQLTTTITPTNATDKTITWSSSDETVATVDNSGLVTAIATGTTAITATTVNSKTATCVVTVSEVPSPVVAIKLPLAQTIETGFTYQQTVTVLPTTASGNNILWTSSDPSVANVDTNGKLTAMKNGKTTLRVTSSNGLYADCVITVVGDLPTLPPDGVIEIATEADMFNIKDDLSAEYRLIADIDLSNISFEPIGSASNPFTGSLDGNGFKIINLKIEDSIRSYNALFAQIENATIKNVTIENPQIYGKDYVGAFIGIASGGLIENCSITGNGYVKGAQVVGGFVGKATNFKIIKDSSDINVTANNNTAGGLVGKAEGITIEQSTTKGYIASKFNNSGGLVGNISNKGTSSSIFKSYTLGDIRGASRLSGLVGWIDGTAGHVAISDSFSQSKITSTGNKSAGIVGETVANTMVNNCYYSGVITSAGDIGGIVGLGNASIENSYFNSTVTGLTEPTEQAKTTSELQQESTYEGWDFSSVWEINEGSNFPTLRY